MAKYTIDDLFRVRGECEFEMRGKKVKLYLATLGHVQHDFRQNYASSRARAALRALKDKKSEEYGLYMTEFDDMDRSDLEEAADDYHTQMDLPREAVKEIRPLDAPEPDEDATIVDVLETEELNEEIQRDVETERKSWVEESSNGYKKELKRKSLDELREICKDYRRRQVTNSVYSDSYGTVSLYHGVFLDEARSRRRFKKIEDAASCDESLRSRLLMEYLAMDTFAGEPEELKN